jgi:hypothetical protein
MGFRMMFTQGMLTGTLSSNFKATSMLQHSMDNFIMMSFHSQLDFQKPEKPAMFGVGISIGGGM